MKALVQHTQDVVGQRDMSELETLLPGYKVWLHVGIIFNQIIKILGQIDLLN